jgi:hypothetical protein
VVVRLPSRCRRYETDCRADDWRNHHIRGFESVSLSGHLCHVAATAFAKAPRGVRPVLRCTRTHLHRTGPSLRFETSHRRALGPFFPIRWGRQQRFSALQPKHTQFLAWMLPLPVGKRLSARQNFPDAWLPPQRKLHVAIGFD